MLKTVVRISLIVAGWVSLALAVAGVVLPVLPTTPFVLLSAGCFAKSSPRFHQWLLRQKYFGQMIRDYQAYRGIQKQTKIRAISLIWLSMTISALIIGKVWLAAMLFSIAICVSLYLWRMPNAPTSSSQVIHEVN
ncbi:YbaN family protein [Catenovulum agarivorans]|uniref:YbaN family protein n=1 Tax=Catenovulum agarivorans TaxID=1172192 RepID=UPI0006888D89|nr:YbaN family protein [Catenovulum agarivorans]